MHKKQGWVETVKTLIFAVSLAIIFRSFAFEPFHIPSGSMKDTLLIGDFIFVSKSSYGYSRYSFPLGIPFFQGRVFERHKPERGDIIVFRLPSNPHVDYIKRLIGLPGDRIQMKNGMLYINDAPALQERTDDYIEQDPDDELRIHNVPRYHETLPNGVVHDVLDDIENGEVDDTDVYIVPDKHYFFMGDNRDHSADSRYLERVGYVPEENIVGKAFVVVMSVKEGHTLFKFWDWGNAFRTDRFWKWIVPEKHDVSQDEK